MSNPETTTILLAADDSRFRTLARATFEREGFRVVEAERGHAVAGIAEREHPTLILISAEFSDADGFQICTAIRCLPHLQDTAIILVAGPGTSNPIDRACAAGADDIILKPIDGTLLRHRARLVLSAYHIGDRERQNASKIRALMKASPDTLLVIDRGGALLDHNNGPEIRLFVELREHGRATVFDALPEKLAKLWRRQLSRALLDRSAQTSKFRLKRNGSSRYFETRMVPYLDQQAVVTIRDITEQDQATAKVHRLASVDTLTGLRNRQSFLSGLSEAIQSAEANETMLAVLCIDLDNFKRINDSLGHTFGDELLKRIADRLWTCIRRDDFVARYDPNNDQTQLARLGGDEFTVTLRDIQNLSDAEGIGERITAAISKPLAHGGHEFVITASIGIAVYPDDGCDSDSLIKNSNVAMHQAKIAGGNGCCVFSGTMSVRSLERLELEDSLRRAITNDDLELHYQPKLALATGQVTGVEALLRWTHSERGPISPDTFIPLAEDAGLIVDLSQWVLRTACRQIREWQNGPVGEIPIAVNLSGQQFHDSDVHDVVTKTLFESSIKPWLLQLELTESILMQDLDRTIEALQRLKESGLSVAVDDFGTGYCSLSYLKKFPIDTIKIDRSFIAELHADGGYVSICTAIIALGHSLGLKVIAEGVESAEQFELLKAQGCDEIQGYYFAKPQPANATAQFLLAHRQTASDRPDLRGPRESEEYA